MKLSADTINNALNEHGYFDGSEWVIDLHIIFGRILNNLERNRDRNTITHSSYKGMEYSLDHIKREIDKTYLTNKVDEDPQEEAIIKAIQSVYGGNDET